MCVGHCNFDQMAAEVMLLCCIVFFFQGIKSVLEKERKKMNPWDEESSDVSGKEAFAEGEHP